MKNSFKVYLIGVSIIFLALGISIFLDNNSYLLLGIGCLVFGLAFYLTSKGK